MEAVVAPVLGMRWAFDEFSVERIVRLGFGDLVLDISTRQLLRGSEELRLSPKAFELLRLLIDERPRAMAKNELIERLWPDTYVAEANLPSLVAEIREVTGDDAEEPRFIRTIRRFGYAFCATVTDDAAAGAAPLGSWLMCGARQIRLSDGENIIGREPEAAVWLDFSAVSRRHARIVLSGDRATVEDLGSKNGTQVRGERISGAVELEDGDEIRIGSVVLNFRMPGRPGSTVSLV
jgi:DNA-binding winged helix-turn-helix (wHTH) protein